MSRENWRLDKVDDGRVFSQASKHPNILMKLALNPMKVNASKVHT